MAEPQLRRMTPDEFFAWQEKQDKLYELVDGLPVAPLKMMMGATRGHDRVQVNMIALLANQLHGTSCTVATDNLAIRITDADVRRPDLSVYRCRGGRRDMEVKDPRVVIEVLSPSTMGFDRIRKLAQYQTVPAVVHVLLVDTEAPRVDLWSRDANGRWSQIKVDGVEARIDLPAIGASLRLADMYEGLEFDIL